MLPEDGDWVVPVEGEAPAVEPQQPDLFGQHPAQQQPQQPPQGDWVQPHEVGFWESLGNSAERGARSFYRNWQGLPGQLQGQAMAEDIQRRIAAGEDSVWTRRFIDNPELLETLRQQYAENAAQALPIVAEQNRRIQELPQHPAAEAMQRAQTWGEAWDHFTSAPLQVIANIGLESLVQQAPSLAAGAVAGGVGGLPALMATIGLGSAHTEYMGGIFSALSEEGVDITNPEALRAALLDQELMGRVRHRSAVKAGVVGLFDAGSAGLASRVLLPAATFASRPVARHLTNVGVQVPAQGAMGGAGEALGSVASGQDVSPGAVMGEIVGEAFGAPAEVAAARHARRPAPPTPPVGDWVVPAEPAVEPAAPTPLPSSGPQAAITGFYSPAERAVTELPRKQGPAQAWFNDLKKRGVSDDELDWMGLPQFMEENRGRPISREEMAEFIRENGAQLDEVVQDNSSGPTREEIGLEQFGLPWDQLNERQQFWATARADNQVKFLRIVLYLHKSNFPEGTTNPRNFLVRLPGLNYESPHFGGPTVSFIRVADTVGPNGEKTLLVHGNQSELHQQAEKQGYSDEVSPNPRGWETTDGRPAFVPNAPLKGDRWWQLGLKLALRQAVAEGYDAVAISTADQVKATDGNAPASLYDQKMPTWLGKYVKPMGGVVSRETGTGRTVVPITPKMRESISKGQPLFAAHNSPTSEDAQTRALNAVNDGETADIPIKVADGILNDIRSGEASRYLRMVPSEYEVGSLVMLEPAGENVRAVFLTTNDTYTSMLLPRNAIDSLGALHVSPGYTDSGVGGLFFLRFDLPGEFGKRLAGELRHEAGHALRSSGKLSGQVWQRLLGHARSLSSMGMSVRDYLFAKRDAYWQGAPETTTVNEAYTRIYSGRPDFQEVMDQEHVMIMLELHHHGYFSDEQLAPVMDIIRDMEAGVYSDGGVMAGGEPAMAIAGERAKTGSGPMFAISGGPRIPSALSFIREHGGIKDENGELKAILDRPGRGSKGYLVGIVNNKTGVPLDRMRELMVEAGYIQRTPDNRPDETSIQDVLDIIRRIKDGEKVAPLGFEIELLNERDSAIASENRDQILREAEVILATHGMPYDLSETEEARLVELVEGGMAVDDALEQATIETINGRDESEAAAADSRGVAEDGGQAPEGEFGADRAGIESAPDDRAREARAEGGLPAAVTPPPVPVVPPPLPVRTAVPPPVPPGSSGGTGGRGGPPPGDIIPPAPPSGGPPGPLPAPTIIDADVRRSMRDRVNSFARAMNTWWNPMNGLPQLEQYRIGRYNMLGRIDHGERMTEMIWKDFKGASKDDKKAAYVFLTTRGTTSGAISDPKVRQAAEATKHLFNGLGTAAVERGLIPQEAFDKYRDQYLPRLYLKHILSQGSVLGFAGNARPSDLGWTKNRKDIDKETRILMGEVMDPGFLAARGVFRMHRDMSIIDFLDHIAGNDQWVFRDTLVNFNGRLASPYYLRSEATALRERARYEPDETYKNAMRLMAEDMDAVASPLIRKDENVPDGYVQIPDSKRYGMLRGMYVRKEIRDDLLPTMTLLPADVSTIEKMFSPGGAMTRVNSLWKAMKVPLNPATQVRNVMSNAIMMYLSGMSPLRVQRAWSDAGKEIASNGPLYKKALDMGLKASGFSEQEVIRLTKEWAQVEKVEAEQSAWGPLKLAFLFAKHQGAGVVTWAGDKYQYFEGRMKLAMMMDAVKNEGMTPEQGFLKAQDWLFDYSDVHKTVRYARNAPIGMPFVCVDDATEMLTQRGWVSAYDAKVGDMAASMDLSTGKLAWHPVEDIFLSPYDGDMVHVRDRHLDMMMTPDHRVVTYKRRKDGTYHLGVTTAQELVCADHIPVAAEFDHTPVGEPIPDALVEVIGWYVTEGTPHPKSKQIIIYQNAGPKADRIRDALRRAGFTFGEGDQKPNPAGNVLKVFHVHAEFGARVREMCPRKQLTPELVMRLSKSQIRLLVDTMIDGDGSRSNPERPAFIQKNNQTASSFMMALTILGESYGVCQRSDGIDMLSITIRSVKRYCVKRATNDRINYTGNIWCPKVTGTATWVARRNGKVFITHNTYYYKALPKLLEVAATRPLRFLPFVALPYIMAQAFAHMWDVDDDDVEKLRQSLPEYMRKKSSAFILPWRDEHGRWQFFDFGYLLPWSMFWETGQAIASGNITGIVKESGLLGGPILDVISAIKTGGVDPFTQRPIFDKRDPPEKRAWDIASYVWRLAMPPWLTDQSFLLKMRDAYAGTPDRYGEPGLTMGQAALRGAGLNVSPVDPEATRARTIAQMQRDIRDAQIRMRSQLRNQSLSETQRQTLQQQYVNHIAELRRRMGEYSANSDINPRLRRVAPDATSPAPQGDWVVPQQ